MLSQHERDQVRTLWGPGHFTASLRDAGSVSDTKLPSGIFCQVANTRVCSARCPLNFTRTDIRRMAPKAVRLACKC